MDIVSKINWMRRDGFVSSVFAMVKPRLGSKWRGILRELYAFAQVNGLTF